MRRALPPKSRPKKPKVQASKAKKSKIPDLTRVTRGGHGDYKVPSTQKIRGRYLALKAEGNLTDEEIYKKIAEELRVLGFTTYYSGFVENKIKRIFKK